MRLMITVSMLLALTAPARAQEVPNPGAAPPAAAITDAQIQRALRRYRREPSVGRVVRSALRARSASPSRIRDAMDRARASGALPVTQASVRRGQAVDLRGLTGADDVTTNVSTDDDLVLEARMIFRFHRIVFASEEVGLLRELRAAEAERAQIARTVVRLYFERRRLLLERDLLGTRDLLHRVRVLEVEALLDVFTEGAFTRMMGGRPGGP